MITTPISALLLPYQKPEHGSGRNLNSFNVSPANTTAADCHDVVFISRALSLMFIICG
jgi:hypothetical protein